MRLLLDTHALLWWVAGDTRLSRKARAAIGAADNDVHVSAASAWEISTKFRLGKLPGVAAIVDDLAAVLASQAFQSMPSKMGYASAMTFVLFAIIMVITLVQLKLFSRDNNEY